MKKKISSLEKQSLIVCNATSKVSLISEKFETLHKAFKISQQPQPTREVVKPPDYPEQLEFDNYEELSSFDQLLSNYEGPHATYFVSIPWSCQSIRTFSISSWYLIKYLPQICFIQKKLGLVTEHMKFMRLGFGLLMTRDLQLKCTFKGSFGYYQTSNMHFLTLLQGLSMVRMKNEISITKDFHPQLLAKPQQTRRLKRSETTAQHTSFIEDATKSRSSRSQPPKL